MSIEAKLLIALGVGMALFGATMSVMRFWELWRAPLPGDTEPHEVTGALRRSWTDLRFGQNPRDYVQIQELKQADGGLIYFSVRGTDQKWRKLVLGRDYTVSEDGKVAFFIPVK